MKKIFLGVLFVVGSVVGFGQTVEMDNASQVDNELSILLGFIQGKRSWGEIGFAKFSFGGPGISFAKYVAVEIGSNGKRFVMAPKIGAFIGMLSGAGLNLLYYSDFHHGTLVLRPEIGLVFWRFKLMYGYNVRLTKNEIRDLNSHQVNLSVVIPLKRG